VRRLLLAGAGALAARALLSGVPAGQRTNFRGTSVSLAGGPALALAASASSVLGAVLGPGASPRAGTGRAAGAVLVAGLGAGAVGHYDDLVGGRPEHRAKGLRGHLGALREGRLTSGVAKIVGLGMAGLAASALLPERRPVRVVRGASRRTGPAGSGAVNMLLGAGLVAGTANLVNLFDLRPGRALKVGLLVGTPLLAGQRGRLVAGPVGACAALLPDDLGERTMLGDTGANALGALLGVGLAARTGPVGRAVLLAAVAGLTLASERVSFTKVIAGTPGLRELDALGRRPG
jgi:UDP-N-acetylmuramyl pentapeptide phosphotransferase/UDP-N-acetylglucosamine-1-phosphate transferase